MKRPFNRTFGLAALLLASTAAILPAEDLSSGTLLVRQPASGPAHVHVLTANYGNDRTNANLRETLLTTTSVAPGRFGKLGSLPVDGQVYGQPLYVSGLYIPGQGVHDVLFVLTQHNSVYAYDAQIVTLAHLLWSVNLGPSVPTTMFHDYSDIFGEIGILGTGAIDLERGVLYVVSMTLEKGSIVFRLHALGLASGLETLNGPAVISAAAAGTGDGSSGGSLAFDPNWQIQRPGLVLANGAVYVCFGSHADDGPWHGWILSYSASDLTRQLGAVVTTPNGLGGSIWQAGRAPAVDEKGNIYVVTGNGDYDGVANFSESFLKFSGAAPKLTDWFTPNNYQMLADWDLDLSAGPALIPGTHLLVGGDKAGQLYLIDGDSMGRLSATPDGGRTIQAVNRASSGIFDFAIWGRPDGAYIYVQEEEGYIKCYRIVDGSIDPITVSTSTVWAHSPYVGMAVSADGADARSGILWETTGRQTDAVKGILRALDASDITRELWNSELTGGPDRLGTFPNLPTPPSPMGECTFRPGITPSPCTV
jgi:hypothetical protein